MEDKGINTFPDGICPKVNIILRLEFELTMSTLTTTPKLMTCNISLLTTVFKILKLINIKSGMIKLSS